MKKTGAIPKIITRSQSKKSKRRQLEVGKLLTGPKLSSDKIEEAELSLAETPLEERKDLLQGFGKVRNQGLKDRLRNSHINEYGNINLNKTFSEEDSQLEAETASKHFAALASQVLTDGLYNEYVETAELLEKTIISEEQGKNILEKLNETPIRIVVEDLLITANNQQLKPRLIDLSIPPEIPSDLKVEPAPHPQNPNLITQQNMTTLAERIREVQTKLKPKFREPPTYDAADSTLSSFLKEFEYCAQQNGWCDNDKISYVGNYLEGVARLWFNQYLAREANQQKEWADVKEDLKRKFASTGLTAEIKEKLDKRQQKSDESVIKYYNAILELCYEVDINMPIEEISRHVKKGLLQNYLPGFYFTCETATSTAELEKGIKALDKMTKDTRARPDAHAEINQLINALSNIQIGNTHCGRADYDRYKQNQFNTERWNANINNLNYEPWQNYRVSRSNLDSSEKRVTFSRDNSSNQRGRRN